MTVSQREPKYLWLFVLSYSFVLLISNWYDSRLISIFGFIVSPGALLFPFTFLISDVITEVYGFEYSRRAIQAGLVFNLLFIAYGKILVHLPTPSFTTNIKDLDSLLDMNISIIFASISAYFMSEPMNAVIISKLKKRFNGKFIGIRFLFSTMISSGLDSIVFTYLAFYKIYSSSELATLILHIWLVKCCVEIIGLPFSVGLSQKMKDVEKIDNYDYGISYSIVKLGTTYTDSNNKYREKNNH